MSCHKAVEQSTSHNEEMSLTELAVNCVLPAQLEESTRQPRGLIPIRRKQSKCRSKYVSMGDHETSKSRTPTNEQGHPTIGDYTACMASHIFCFLSRSCMRSSFSCWRAFLAKAKPASTGYRLTAAFVLPKFVSGYATHPYSECHMNTEHAVTF